MKGLTVGEIEGRYIGELNGEPSIKVGDDEDDIEYVTDWVRNNLPSEGIYVRIVVMSFPDFGE